MAMRAGSSLQPLRGAGRIRRTAAESWLLAAAGDRERAATEWDRQGLALLTAGHRWDAVRIPPHLLNPALDRHATPALLRYHLTEARLSGAVFCDPYRPFLYLLVPPGADDDWPRALTAAGAERLGSDHSHTCHVGVPRIDRDRPPGSYWLQPPDSGGRRHVDAARLRDVLHARVHQPESGTP
ncbi:MAG: hypothetical protein HOY79_34200 [Streptomyces sp.]|nr:hypothetical protein [Streptomyces sp.]NUS11389.1 hypothetical protein [Streptomyces sp.]NUS23470.1 hypothetical protein [Streptomyces sp.]